MPDANLTLFQRDGDYSACSARKNNWPQVHGERLVAVSMKLALTASYSTFTKAGQEEEALGTYEGISQSTITKIIEVSRLGSIPFPVVTKSKKKLFGTDR